MRATETKNANNEYFMHYKLFECLVKFFFIRSFVCLFVCLNPFVMQFVAFKNASQTVCDNGNGMQRNCHLCFFFSSRYFCFHKHKLGIHCIQAPKTFLADDKPRIAGILNKKKKQEM